MAPQLCLVMTGKVISLTKRWEPWEVAQCLFLSHHFPGIFRLSSRVYFHLHIPPWSSSLSFGPAFDWALLNPDMPLACEISLFPTLRAAHRCQGQFTELDSDSHHRLPSFSLCIHQPPFFIVSCKYCDANSHAWMW